MPTAMWVIPNCVTRPRGISNIHSGSPLQRATSRISAGASALGRDALGGERGRCATMARITGVGGVFFKSKGNSAALAAWYRKHLGLRLEDFGGAILRWPEDKAE